MHCELSTRELVESTQPLDRGGCKSGKKGLRWLKNIHWLCFLAVANDKFQKAKLLIKY